MPWAALLHVAGNLLGVAAPCSSTAAAMVDEISDSLSMVPEISLMVFTDSCVAAGMPEICWPISPIPPQTVRIWSHPRKNTVSGLKAQRKLNRAGTIRISRTARHGLSPQFAIGCNLGQQSATVI